MECNSQENKFKGVNMKAIVYTRYGSPEVLQLEEVEKPVPKDGEVLVKVYAADWHLLRAKPFLIRLMGGGFLRPKNKILGADIAGRVEVAGSNVSRLQPRDKVFGDLSTFGNGGFAEYVCAPENG